MRAQCFAPVARPDARVLILGSLPGEESLRQQQYYAQPRNAFWKIMERLLGIDALWPFARRAEQLTARRIALWDVCAAAERAGSLDAAIVSSSIETNEFGDFLHRHPSITCIIFNGRKAYDLYEKRVLPTLCSQKAALKRLLLPSTSPAHAGMTFEQKCLRWREGLNEFITSSTQQGQEI